MIELNWGGLIRPESRRYSSSVRIVLKERFAAATSGILFDDFVGKRLVWWIVRGEVSGGTF